MTLVTQAPEESAPATRSRSHSQVSSSKNAQDGSDVPESAEEKKGESEFQEQDDKLKKNYEEFYEVIQAHQADPIVTLTKKEERTTA